MQVTTGSKPVQSSFLARMQDRVSKLVAEVRLQRARYRAYQTLNDLSDRTLNDIGIERGRIWEVIDTMVEKRPVQLTCVAPKSARVLAGNDSSASKRALAA